MNTHAKQKTYKKTRTNYRIVSYTMATMLMECILYQEHTMRTREVYIMDEGKIFFWGKDFKLHTNGKQKHI